MPKMELALRRSGPDDRVELIWRGGETARGAKRAAELEAGLPLEGKAVAHDAIARELEGVAHGAIVTAHCSFQPGHGFVADSIVSIEPFTPSARNDHDALVLRIRTHAEAGNYGEAEALLVRLLDLEPRAMPLPPVHAALRALGDHVSDHVLTRVAAFYGAHVGRTGVFPDEIPLRHWPRALLVARGQKLASAGDVDDAVTRLTSIIATLRETSHGDAADELVAARARLAKTAGEQKEAVSEWRSRVLAKGKPLDLGTTVKLTAAHLREIDVTTAARKAMLATPLPTRVAPQWRATIPKAAPLVRRANDYYAIGVADGPEDEQITATIVIDREGGVHHIVDDGDREPERVASTLATFAKRLHVMRSYLSTSKRLVGKAGRSERFEEAARAVLARVERATMSDYWDPAFWIADA